MIIKCKIDVTKIEKARLYIGKTGRQYLDCTLLENRDGTDQYGNDFMIVQDVSKDDRLAGIKGQILGNAKIMEKRDNPQPQPDPSKNEAQDGGRDSEIPF